MGLYLGLQRDPRKTRKSGPYWDFRKTRKSGPQRDPGKTRKLRPQRDPRKTRKLGPRTLAGPYKNQKTRTRDLSWTLKKPGPRSLVEPQRDPTKTRKLRSRALARPQKQFSFWWSLHKLHKCISFTSQIARLTAGGLSDFADFFFLRFLGVLDGFL